ncbi:MAG: hypothetical protein ACYTGP_02165 [Planctomycetota bacterium]
MFELLVLFAFLVGGSIVFCVLLFVIIHLVPVIGKAVGRRAKPRSSLDDAERSQPRHLR